MRTAIVAALVVGVLAAGPVAAEAAHAFVIDQANDAFLTTQGYVIPGGSPVGQSFVPTLTSLNVVELQMNSQLTQFGGTAIVQIRSGGIAGPIIGVSQSGSVPPYSTSPSIVLVHFDFLVPVALIPGATYVIEVVAVSGTMGVFTSGFGDDSYALGTAFFMGTPRPEDLWFREGDSSVVPVAEVTWGRVKAMYR